MRKQWYILPGLVFCLSLQTCVWADDIKSTTTIEVSTPAAGPFVEMKAAAVPAVRSDLNSIQGKLQSKSNDPQTLRITTDGGFNVEFTYDAHTTLTSGGQPLAISELRYGDVLVIRYSGKELNVIAMDRLSKAPRPY